MIASIRGKRTSSKKDEMDEGAAKSAICAQIQDKRYFVQLLGCPYMFLILGVPDYRFCDTSSSTWGQPKIGPAQEGK